MIGHLKAVQEVSTEVDTAVPDVRQGSHRFLRDSPSETLPEKSGPCFCGHAGAGIRGIMAEGKEEDAQGKKGPGH